MKHTLPLLSFLAAASSSQLHAESVTWDGSHSGISANWSATDGASDSNWTGGLGGFGTPSAGDDLHFAGSAGTTNTNDYAAGTSFNSLVFDAAASPFTIGGNGITLGSAAGIINGSSSLQTLNTDVTLTNAATVINTGASGLTLGGILSGTGFGISKTGAGTLTLTGANTYTGVTALTAGSLVLANPAALGGTSTLTFSGTGTVLDIATDGGDTAFNSNAGAGTTTTILSNRATTGAGLNHTLGTGAYSGVTINVQKGANVASGTASLTYGAVALTSGTSGAVTNFNPTSANLFIGNVSTTTNNVAHTLGLDGTSTGNEVTGVISNGLTAAVSIQKTGTGTWKLSGANTATGFVTVAGGQLNITGSLGTNATNGNFKVGTVANTKAILNILPGAAINNRFNLFIGDAGAGTGGGAVYQSGGSLTLTQAGNVDNLRIGSNAGGYGYYGMSGGTLTTNEIGVGASLSGTVGVMDMSAGTVTNNGWLNVGRGSGTGSGLFNMTGGTATALRIDMNFAGTTGALSVLNVGGGAGLASLSTTGSTTLGLSLASANIAGTTGIANLLSNGTLTTGTVTAGATGTGANPTAVLNFNGGILKASSTNAGVNFLTSANVDAVNVYSGGGTVDNNGTAITIGKPLLAPTDNGVSSIPVATGGSGYIGAPMVTITGGTGSGATAYAKMVDDGTGNGTFKIDSIVVTSPGGYTVDPTAITLLGGGATTSATFGTLTTATNTSGGMIFTGSAAGITTLTGASTFSGDITISGGTKVIANLGKNVLNPTNSSLGNNQVSRSINVTGASTLQFNSGDTLGSAVSNFGTKIIVGAGSTVTNVGGVFNRLGSLDLNGGTLSTVSGAVAGYQSYSFDANAVVTVGGSAASSISAGAGAFSGVHLNTNTEFNVGDATSSTAADLTISAPLIDRNDSEIAAGGLKKTGVGTLVISSTSTYTGPTSVNAGTLLVNGSLGDTAVTVAAGAVLGGSNGTIGLTAGSVNVASGGILAPGSSIGNLYVNGSVTVAGTYAFEYNGGTGAADLLDVNGTLTLNNATLGLNDFAGDSYSPGEKFTLIAYDTLTLGSLFTGYADDTEYTFGGGNWLFNYNDTTAGLNGGTGTNFITITAVPEPATALLGALGMLGLLRRRRA